MTEDSEVRRLADLLLFNDVPYRGAQVLEAAIEKKIVNLDDKLYEKLANCWIAAGEFDKSVPPLQRAAEMATHGRHVHSARRGAGAARGLAGARSRPFNAASTRASSRIPATLS